VQGIHKQNVHHSVDYGSRAFQVAIASAARSGVSQSIQNPKKSSNKHAIAWWQWCSRNHKRNNAERSEQPEPEI
jgi:hypothetical protein